MLSKKYCLCIPLFKKTIYKLLNKRSISMEALKKGLANTIFTCFFSKRQKFKLKMSLAIYCSSPTNYIPYPKSMKIA